MVDRILSLCSFYEMSMTVIWTVTSMFLWLDNVTEV